MTIMDEGQSNDWLLNYRSKRAQERREYEEKQEKINADLRHERALIKRNQIKLASSDGRVTVYNPPAWHKKGRKL